MDFFKLSDGVMLKMLRHDQSEWVGILVKEQGFGGCLLCKVLGVNPLVAGL